MPLAVLGKVQGFGFRWRQASPQRSTEAKSGQSKQLLIDSSTITAFCQTSPPSALRIPALKGETRPAPTPYQRICPRREAQRCRPRCPAASGQSVQTQLTGSHLHTPPDWAVAETRTPSTVSLRSGRHKQGWKAPRLLKLEPPGVCGGGGGRGYHLRPVPSGVWKKTKTAPLPAHSLLYPPEYP